MEKQRPLYVKLATAKTPEIRMFYEQAEDVLRVVISGRCIPENPIEFFAPLIERMKQKLSQSNAGKVVMDLDIEYINSISIKFMIKILNVFKEYVSKNNKEFSVRWYYEDEDTYEVGADLSYITDLEFEYIEKE